AMDPCRKAGPPIETGEATHDRDQCFLGGVECIGVVPGDLAADDVDMASLITEKACERALVTIAGRANELVFVGGGHRKRFRCRRSGEVVDATPTCWLMTGV